MNNGSYGVAWFYDNKEDDTKMSNMQHQILEMAERMPLLRCGNPSSWLVIMSHHCHIVNQVRLVAKQITSWR